jgi:predicted  nucleic acid-binding Zn-ribbon protein
MPDVKEIMRSIIELNDLEDQLKESPENPALKQKSEDLRKKIPTPMLGHHDRLRNRGRRSVSPVRNDVCEASGIRIHSGLRRKLFLVDEIVICENSGVYLYLPEDEKSRLEALRDAKKSE